MIPSNILLEAPILVKAVFKAVFKAPTGGSMTNIMISPISRIPHTGHNNTGVIFSNASGNLENTFFSNKMISPARKPAASAPRKPDFPFAAIIPPTKPTASAGLSPILIAINPASTGSISPNAIPPICLNAAATGVIVPKFALISAESELISTFIPSIRNAIAIRIPPPTTNGSIWDTPFIRCTYNL